MLEQELNKNLSTSLIDSTFSSLEPFIEQIKEKEKGLLHKKTQSLLSYYFNIAPQELKNRIQEKYRAAYHYIEGEFENDLPPHQDHWVAAKKGDIIRKTGTHYASSLENGNYYVVLDVYNGDSTAVVLDTDGQIKTACFPEEYEVVGNVKKTLKERDEKHKKQAREMNLKIWAENGLNKWERADVDRLKKANEIGKIVEKFTENWEDYYKLGETKPDLFEQLFPDLNN